MKTIKETIEKWNEMYELAIAGCTSAENTVWQQMQQVFMISDDNMSEAFDLRSKYIEDCNTLTEEDMEADKDTPIHMRFIKRLLSLSGQCDYAFYIYNGEVGVLCELDDKTIKAKGYESFNGIAFVPAWDMDEVLKQHLGEKPHLTLDDSYSTYGGCTDIDIHRIVNPENEQRLVDNWVSDVYADTDEYERELCQLTDSYCEWTSSRSDMVEQIVNAINDEEDLSVLKDEWDSTVAEYHDSLGTCIKRVDFVSVVDDALCAADVIAYGEYKRHDYDKYNK